jgi:transcriptional regulator with XRE-family HTH domain
MKITPQLTDDAALRELGSRLASARLERNLTQAALAEQAGVAKRTVERLESGAVATQLSGFLRVCRVLGVLERFDALIPEPTLSPMAQLKLQGRKRQRAARATRATAADPLMVSEPKPWTWGKTS